MKANMEIKLEKRILDGENEIIVRAMNDIEGREIKIGTNIVEIVTQGCVVAFYELRRIDGDYWFAELHEVHDRLTSVEMGEGKLLEAISFGRKIATFITDFMKADTQRKSL